LHTDQQYIDALRQNDEKLIAKIYQNHAPGIKAYLQSKGASTEDAGDIFQEAILDVYKLALDEKFVLSCPLEAFLLLVCKRKWINQREKFKRQGVTKSLDIGFPSIADDDDHKAAADVDRVEKENLVMTILHRISERCREIIIAAYSGWHQEKLANEMGVSYAYLRKKKSQCMAELIKLVRNGG